MKFLNSNIFMMIMIIRNFMFSFIDFCVIVIFWTKLLILGFFSSAVKAVAVAKLVILGIWFSNSFILVVRVVLVAKLVISGILTSIFFNLALYTPFLTTSFFTTSLSLLKSRARGTNLLTFNLST